MGCISKLLQLKDDFNVNHKVDIIIEGGGIYKEYEYLIIFTDYGYRCGYIAIDPVHPYYGKDLIDGESDIPLIVHGGITFHQKNHVLKSYLSHPCEDECIGFDAAHRNDRPCFITAKKYFGETPNISFLSYMNYERPDLKHRTFRYMEKECKNLIEQLRGEAA
jgi:hypothetical protein